MGDEMISADIYTLLQQASMTAEDYLSRAIDAIDRRFGDGYARRNPQLVAAFIRVAGGDFEASSTNKVLEVVLKRFDESLACLAESLTGVAEAIREHQPLDGVR